MGLQLGSPRKKWHLGAGPMARHIEYYKRKGDGFPKSRLWWVLRVVFVHGSFVHQKCSNYALTNLLFGLCKFVRVIDLLITLPNPYPRAPTGTSTLEVMRAKEHTPTLHSSVMFTLDSHLNLLRSLWVCHLTYQIFRFFNILNHLIFMIANFVVPNNVWKFCKSTGSKLKQHLYSMHQRKKIEMHNQFIQWKTQCTLLIKGGHASWICITTPYSTLESIHTICTKSNELLYNFILAQTSFPSTKIS